MDSPTFLLRRGNRRRGACGLCRSLGGGDAAGQVLRSVLCVVGEPQGPPLARWLVQAMTLYLGRTNSKKYNNAYDEFWNHYED